MNKLALVAIASLAAGSLWALHHHRATSRDDAAAAHLVEDRVWLDHLPRNDKDTVQLFALLSDQSFGIFQATSAWRGQHEIFRFELDRAELRLVYPQTGDRERATVKARQCDDNGMDYCLEITGASHGVKKYYSRKGWEIDAGSKASLPQQVEDKLALLTQNS